MAKKKTPQGEVMQRVLSLQLSDADKAKKADLLAELQIEKTSVEDEKKTVSAKYNVRIKELNKSINSLSREVKDGVEEKSVECTMVKNYEENRIEYWYEDQMVESRDMTAEDRQLDLDEQPSVEKKKKGSRKNLKVVDAEQTQDQQIQDVMREETGRKTKRSSVDGVYGGSSVDSNDHVEM